MEGRELLIYLSVKYKGQFEKMFNAIKEKERVNKRNIRYLYARP